MGRPLEQGNAAVSPESTRWGSEPPAPCSELGQRYLSSPSAARGEVVRETALERVVDGERARRPCPPLAAGGVVNRRYENLSATIVTTNRGLPAWAELFGGDAVVAAASLDRLLDGVAVINIKGGSWRLREHQALTEPLPQLNDPPERPARRRR